MMGLTTWVTGDMINTSETSDTGKTGDGDNEVDDGRYLAHGGEEGQRGILAEKMDRRDTLI